jgi:V8-like Glu-specific endopeptidase
MKLFVAASVFALLAASPAIAADGMRASGAPGDHPDINDVINQTNFVVAHQCSGTLISLKYKLVLTNNHCLQGYVDKVEKEETDKDGSISKKTREVYKDMDLEQKSYKGFDEVGSSTVQAKILFHSEKYDLALLKIKADSIPQILASHVLPDTRKVTRGDHIFVVGNPHLLDANLNEGVVSSTTRKLKWDDPAGGTVDVDYYGIDAGVNPGNSGGALYNTDLELIGVPGASYNGATGLGFAIPAETIRAFLSEHCYESVWNDKAADKETCEKGKLDKVNEARAKAGLPAVEAPKEQDSLSGEGTVVRAMHLDIEKPAPVAPVAVPAAPAPKAQWSLLDFLNGWGVEVR